MKSSRSLLLALCNCVIAILPPVVQAQHSHINAGAVAAFEGAPLFFANGPGFAAESGYVLNLEQATNGPYTGYYYGEISFAALPTTPDFGGPSAFAALPGTHVELVVESVSGPAGGSWGFWESENDEDGTQLTFSVPVGTTGGTNRFDLSETDGSPGVDPYGHIHGRIYSATTPGLYRVGFRLRDAAHNGRNGAPLHAPSEVYSMLFQAGVTLANTRLVSEGLRIEFATALNHTYTLQSAEEPGGTTAAWMAAGESVTGDDHLHSVTVPTTVAAARFFRLKVE